MKPSFTHIMAQAIEVIRENLSLLIQTGQGIGQLNFTAYTRRLSAQYFKNIGSKDITAHNCQIRWGILCFRLFNQTTCFEDAFIRSG